MSVSTSTSTSTSTSATAVRPITILIVDDHEGYRSIASEVVAAAPGFTVGGEAKDRAEALARLATGGIDLVLMDVNLGDEDGLVVTHELVELANRQGEELEVMLVTALARQDLPPDAISCGARGHLPKVELSPTALKGIVAGVYDWSDDNASGRVGR